MQYDWITFVPSHSRPGGLSTEATSTIRSHARRVTTRKARLRATQEHKLDLDAQKSTLHAPDGSQPLSRCVSEPIRAGAASRAVSIAASLPALYIPSLNILAGSCVDPFDRLSVEWSRDVQSILQYFHQHALSTLPNQDVRAEDYPRSSAKPNRKPETHHQAVQALLSENEGISCLLAMMAGHMDVLHPNILNKTFSTTMYLRGLRYLQRLIRSRSPSYQMLNNITCLGGAAVYMQDWPGLFQHTEVHHRLLTQMPQCTVEEFESFVRCLVLILIIHTGQRPQITWVEPSPGSYTDNEPATPNKDNSSAGVKTKNTPIESIQTATGPLPEYRRCMIHVRHINTRRDQAKVFTDRLAKSDGSAPDYLGPGPNETTCDRCSDLCWEWVLRL